MRIFSVLGSLVVAASFGSTFAGCSESSSSPSAAVATAGAANAYGLTLYQRLGGHDGIAVAVHAVNEAAAQDPDVGSFFAAQASAGHVPATADIEECLVAFLGKAALGPEAYPLTTTSGFRCRSLSDAHKKLHIGQGTFEAFLSIAAATLKGLTTPYGTQLLSDDDIAAVGATLGSAGPDIVDVDAPSDKAPCQAPDCDAEGAATP